MNKMKILINSIPPAQEKVKVISKLFCMIKEGSKSYITKRAI
jgi:hypothetical protein